MADFVFWLAVVCCLVAYIAITRSALRASSPANDAPANVPRPRRAIEVAWTILPAVGLAFVLLSTWHAIHQPQLPPFMPPGAAQQMHDPHSMHDMPGMEHAAPRG
ncbi:MAG TPA: cytochrome c oxidase subunit II transmembrane domain-containing protein [Gemmatimonadaceae bacterium]